MGSRSRDVQPECAVLDEHERVHPAQVDQVDVDEVAGNDALGLRGQEVALRRTVAAWGRIKSRCSEDLLDRRRADRVPGPDEFALDPAAA